MNKKTDLTEFNLTQGSYILQIYGVLTNAAQIADSIEFTIIPEGESEIKLKQKTHSQYGYGYPYSISQRIDSKGGKVKVVAENGHNGNASLSSQIITLIPIVGWLCMSSFLWYFEIEYHIVLHFIDLIGPVSNLTSSKW